MSTHRYTELDAIVHPRRRVPQEWLRHAVSGSLLAVAGLASGTEAQEPPARSDVSRLVTAVALSSSARDSLRVTIRRLVDSAGLASLTVGVSVAGRTVWAEGFGYADLASRVPATPDTRYSLASITKPLTATAVMRLAEKGRVQLDAPANRYLRNARLTGIAGSADSATVRRLLSHTAGLPLHYRFYYAGQDGYADDGLPDVARTVERYGVVMFPPGVVYSYSNLGYGILGEIVSAASGMPYETYLRENVFLPLGMARTTTSTGAGLTNSAVRYDATGRAIPPYDFDHRAASAVYSTAHDLLRFAEFHLGTLRNAPGGFLADSTVRRMQQAATPPVATPGGYGLGWFIDDDNGVRRVRHSGGMPGVSTVLSLYPDAGVAVVALANQSSPLPGRVVSDLAAAVMPAYAKVRAMRRAAPDTSVRTGATALRPVGPAAFAAPTPVRGTWRGTARLYDRSIPVVLWVGDSDVRAKIGDRALWTLVNDATFQNGILGGRLLGTIPTDDARRAPHVLVMSLRLHDNTLRGWLAAQVNIDTNNFSLSSYADLKKDSTTGVP